MERIDAHRVIATVHSFRFFGLVFLLPGVVGPFARWLRHLRRLWRLCNRTPGHPGASHGEGASALLVVRRRLQSPWNGRHPHRLLPRRQVGLPALAGQFGVAYPIPIIYVPMLMITHIVALYWLARPQRKAVPILIGNAAAS